MLGILIIVFILYLVFLPLYPVVNYMLFQGRISKADSQDMTTITEQTEIFMAEKKTEGENDFTNRLVIVKIGVSAPILEGLDENALDGGAWRLPGSSTPDQGGNTIITGHRFKYLPPNNLIFYLFDKLTVGNIFSVFWDGRQYYYRIREIKRVPANDVNILVPTGEPIVTMFTYDSIWSKTNRLVVIGERIEK